mmetsp:Transcript_19570/g.30651  ORF Transcript_19570/g.30651 Transcript_19570/m.30651 type:complete len:225 (+) Transcript_19570:35-709(+)
MNSTLGKTKMDTAPVKLGSTISTTKTNLGRPRPTAQSAAMATNPDTGDMPPLHGACHKGNSQEVKRLIESGEDVNEQSKSGMTPMMCAGKVIGPKPGDDQIVQYLLEQKADLALQDVMGDTALHVATQSKDPSNPLLPTGFDKLVKALIDANAPLDMSNKLGQTALHRASQRGNIKVVQHLIEAKADVEIVDRCGRTARDVAFDQEIADLLTPPPPEETAEDEA